MIVIATLRCHDDPGFAQLHRRGQHDGALLTTFTTSCGEFENGHLARVPAEFAEGHRKQGFVEGVHGLESESARHSVYGIGVTNRRVAQLFSHRLFSSPQVAVQWPLCLAWFCVSVEREAQQRHQSSR